jgi:hypothetical protein
MDPERREHILPCWKGAEEAVMRASMAKIAGEPVRQLAAGLTRLSMIRR